jgi:hypothetical protein
MYGYSDPSYPAWRCLLRGPESSCRHGGLLRFLYECLADVEYTVEDGSLGKYARLLVSFETCEPLDLRAFGLGLVGEVVLGVADFIHFCGVWRVDGIAGEFVW